jgi:hypothetical protein
MIAREPSASSGSVTLDEHLRKAPPAALYHYTDTKALIGIAQSRKLWATDLGFLNDEAEREHGIQLARGRIAELRPPAPVAPTPSVVERAEFFRVVEERDFFRALEQQAGNWRDSSRVYGVSFTEAIELSMFRMYCPDGGYCLKFPRSGIQSAAEKQGFRLVKCIYRDHVKQKTIEEWLQPIIANFRHEQEARTHKGPGPSYSQDAITFGERVWKWAPLMKHESFKSENEWRIVSSQPKKAISFRESRFSITPYYEFELDFAQLVTPNSLSDSFEVWLGPANINQSRRKIAVEQMFRQLHPGPIPVRIFLTSYR